MDCAFDALVLIGGCASGCETLRCGVAGGTFDRLLADKAALPLTTEL